MAQTVITKAFTEWKAQQAIDNQPVNLDEFIFAYIPDLDVTKPVENTEGLPPADKIVHRQAVSKSGVVNANSVVYSVTLGADVGDFNFNWIGLANKKTGTLAMIIHAPTQSKIKNASGQQGNVLVRSMLMEYSGAEAATNITTPAETWQIDFTARLAAMDERQRLENVDIYGAAAFFDSGYLVAKSGSQFFVTKGVGYVAGLRSVLAANQNVTISTKPVKVWLDVSWTGTLTSEWKVQSKITVASSLADYAESGVQHHVFALASIDASGNITDLRPKGSLDDQAASDALAKHEKSRNHPDATISEKGFTRLSSETGSDLEDRAATPKAVKSVNDSLTELKKSLGTAAAKDAQTSKDDVTAGRLLVNGGALAVRTVAAKSDATGSNVTDANNLPANSVSFLYSTADNSDGITGSLLSFSGLSGNYPVQIAANYGNGRSIKFRTFNGDAAQKWNPWYDIYHSGNKPTSGDVDAVSASQGGTFQKSIIVKGNGASVTVQPLGAEQASYLLGKGYNGGNTWYVGRGGANNNVSLYNYIGLNGVVLSEDGAIAINPAQGKSLRIGTVGSAILNIGDSDSGLRNSVDGQIDLLANSKVMGYWNTTIFSFTGQIIPTNYANFDSRYYTKAQSDAGYMPKTSAYTKAESDGRFQPKGSYAAPDTSGISGNVLWWKNTATGVITMMGQTAGVANSGRVTFPFAFPSKCFGVVPTRNNTTGNAAAMQPYDVNTTGWNLRIAGGGTETVMWIAMGK